MVHELPPHPPTCPGCRGLGPAPSPGQPSTKIHTLWPRCRERYGDRAQHSPSPTPSGCAFALAPSICIPTVPLHLPPPSAAKLPTAGLHTHHCPLLSFLSPFQFCFISQTYRKVLRQVQRHPHTLPASPIFHICHTGFLVTPPVIQKS